ncbi:hypothetical protein QVA60_09180 [Staphylococcus chromogenes]|uniref:DUF7366 family protein n=1 Tax=Staphylococcus chromogenes TaxID=46126 RepID=UPI002902C39F|nr:hypothetical protein [Staphylococcus chromogenes]MDU0430655.1 hypothetical protein [Staphylococcus chromogenes]
MFKLPEKYTKAARDYKQKSKEDKEEFDKEIIKIAREESSLLRNMTDEQIVYWFRKVVNAVDTRTDNKE